MYTNYFASDNNYYRSSYDGIRAIGYRDAGSRVYPIVSMLSDEAWDSWCSRLCGLNVILDTSVLMAYRKENLCALYDQAISRLNNAYNTTFYITEDVKADLNTLAGSYDPDKAESIELARECRQWLSSCISRGVVKVAGNSARRDADASIRQLADQLMRRGCKVAVLTRDRSMATELLKAGVWTWYVDTKLKVVQFTNLSLSDAPQRREHKPQPVQHSKANVADFKPAKPATKKKGFFHRLLALFGGHAT